VGASAAVTARRAACWHPAARAYLAHGGFDCARDDVIDAAVLLACALHWDRCLSLPERPGNDPKGLPMEILYLPAPARP